MRGVVANQPGSRFERARFQPRRNFIIENRALASEATTFRAARNAIGATNFRPRTSDSKNNSPQKIECGPGQPPEPHRTWIPLCLCHRFAVDDRFSPTALRRTPLLLKPAATRDLAIANRNRCGGQQALS